jgi:hypothetical protein
MYYSNVLLFIIIYVLAGVITRKEQKNLQKNFVLSIQELSNYSHLCSPGGAGSLSGKALFILDMKHTHETHVHTQRIWT